MHGNFNSNTLIFSCDRGLTSKLYVMPNKLSQSLTQLVNERTLKRIFLFNSHLFSPKVDFDVYQPHQIGSLSLRLVALQHTLAHMSLLSLHGAGHRPCVACHVDFYLPDS